jgi:thioredoxin 1
MSYAKYKSLGDSKSNGSTGGSTGGSTSTGGGTGGNPNFQLYSLQSAEDKKQAILKNRVCVIDIYGDWCGPCKLIEPKFQALAEKYNRPGYCALVKENVDLTLSPNVGGVPTFQFYFQGRFESSITGGDMKSIEAKIQELLNLNQQ